MEALKKLTIIKEKFKKKIKQKMFTKSDVEKYKRNIKNIAFYRLKDNKSLM